MSECGCSHDYEGYLAEVEKHIALVGHNVTGVSGGPEDPTFAYTVGRAAKGLPELIIVGLRLDLAHQIINLACQEIDSMGRVPTAGVILTETANFAMPLGSVGPVGYNDFLVQAVQRGERLGYPVTALQMVMCDREGVYPNQPGYDAHGMQRQLCLAPDGVWDYDTTRD